MKISNINGVKNMNNYFRPGVRDVKLNDSFWTPYTEGIRDIMIPYCFDKFSETGYVANFESVAKKDGAKHIGPPFSDGLVLETITGACLFLAANYDKVVDEQLDKLIDTILSAQEDGSVCLVYVTEGKFHQVKRMLQAVGHPVIHLHREKIAMIELDKNLSEGEWRELTPEEIHELYVLTEMNE